MANSDFRIVATLTQQLEIKEAEMQKPTRFVAPTIICIVLIWTGTLRPAVAEVADTLWSRTYDAGGQEVASSVRETSDGGYILAGKTGDLSYPHGFYIIRTDSKGDTLWTRIYSRNYCQANDIQQTPDGGFVVAGWTSLNQGTWLIKLDADGDSVWSKSYDGICNALELTSDGGYIMAGHRMGELWVMKTDSTGYIEWWQGYYPGPGGNEAYAVQETFDGNYIVAGIAYPGDICYLKFSAAGDLVWSRIHAQPGAGDAAHSVRQTQDGGYIMAGSTPEIEDAYLLTVDASGDTVWSKSFGGAHVEVARSLDHAVGEGYIVCGHTNSFGWGLEDVYIIRTDSLGATIWTGTLGTDNNDAAYSIRQTSDGGFILAGSTDFGYDKDVYLVKLPAETPRKKWTILAYLNGDNNLDKWVFRNVNEMEMEVDTSLCNLVVQWDRVEDAEWSETRRYFITSDGDTTTVNSIVLDSMGEQDMGDPDVLADFLIWGIENYPAEHYCVTVYGHGNGWYMNLYEPDDLLLRFSEDYSSGHTISIAEGEWEQALSRVREAIGGRIDLWCFESCLMGMIEVEYAGKEYIDFIVHSEHNMDAQTYPWHDILRRFNMHPEASPDQLGSYIAEECVKSYRPFGSQWRISEVSCTESVVHLDTSFGSLCAAVDRFARELMMAGGRGSPYIRNAILLTQSYDGAMYADHIDLYHFAHRINWELSSPLSLRLAAREVMDAVGYPPPEADHPLVYEGHFTNLFEHSVDNSHGIAIYCPLDKPFDSYGLLGFAKENSWWAFIRGLVASPREWKSVPVDKILDGRDGEVADLTQGVRKERTGTWATQLVGSSPNPLRDRTMIAYTLSFRGNAALEVYDASGRLVRTLLDEGQVAGHHVIEWDGRDYSGMLVSAGIYFYRLTAGDFTDMKKMVVVR